MIGAILHKYVGLPRYRLPMTPTVHVVKEQYLQIRNRELNVKKLKYLCMIMSFIIVYERR
jgi:hypothetical protein